MKMILMFSSRHVRLPVLLSGLVLVAGMTACSTPDTTGDPGQTRVVVGAYPFEFVANRVAGELASVTNLLAPGADGHDLELSPQQVAAIDSADLVIYQWGYQPAFDEAVEQSLPDAVLDTGDFLTLRSASEQGDTHVHDAAVDEGDDHGDYDPHVWLDPLNIALMGDQVAAVLSHRDPDNAATYQANAASLAADVKALDASFSSGLADCRTDTFVTSHAAFGYLADRYQLHQVGISGLTTEEEPSPARIAQIQQIAAEHQLTTIFYETAVSPKLAETIAGDLGLVTDVLDPLGTLSADSPGGDYLEVMQSNLEALRKANGCR